MKIGILTFHRPINYGAYLQAFSLQDRLKEYLREATIEIVDYIAPKERKKIWINVLWGIKHYGVKNGIKDIQKIKAFRKSYNFLPLSESIFTSNLKKLYEYIDEKYDLLIIGSDAVFNWKQNGYPTAFIPNYSFRHCKIITYAASVHGMKFLEESQERIKECHNAFSRMEYIGVRDTCTEHFVKYCLHEAEPIHCCDPTVVIDINKVKMVSSHFSERIKTKYGCDLNKKYIVLMLPDGRVSKKIREVYSGEYQIITLFKPSEDADYYLYDLNPFEWTRVLSMAALVITSYFHGALLSLKQSIPVIVVDYSNYNNPYEGKLKDLMERRFCLKELYFDSNKVENEEECNKLLEIAENAINGLFLNQINKSIAREGEYFKNFVELIEEL